MEDQRLNGPAEAVPSVVPSDGFRVSELGAKAILDAIRACRADLDAHEANLRQIKQRPLLGSSPGAHHAATHALNVATGDEWAFETGVLKARAYLDDLESGLRAAMAGYQDVDDERRVAIMRAGPA